MVRCCHNLWSSRVFKDCIMYNVYCILSNSTFVYIYLLALCNPVTRTKYKYKMTMHVILMQASHAFSTNSVAPYVTQLLLFA